MSKVDHTIMMSVLYTGCLVTAGFVFVTPLVETSVGYYNSPMLWFLFIAGVTVFYTFTTDGGEE